MKRVWSCVLIVLCLMLALAPAAMAAETGKATSNMNAHNYSPTASPVNSYLVENSQGYVRVEYTVDVGYAGGFTYTPVLFTEQYNKNLQFVSYRQLTMELPVFGGFYTDGNYYYLVFGQQNTNEHDNVEIMRVVKYNSAWEKLGSASIYGANTTVPFDAGSLRMVHTGNTLFIHTAHEMYTASDGKNHQANMTFSIDLSTMKPIEQKYDVSNLGTGYVSHSFNQYIALDGKTLITLDHGDYYPRSAVLCKYDKSVDQKPLSGNVTSVNLMTYTPGSDTDYNYTGACVGGLEVTSSHYLTVGSSIRQDGTVSRTTGQRNIYITVTPKDKFTEGETSLVWLTQYADNAGITVQNPHLVRVDESAYAVIWSEVASGVRSVKFAFVNAKGQQTAAIASYPGQLSDCKPIVTNGKILWYATNNTAPTFYYIDLNDGNQLKESHQHVYNYAVTTNPTVEAEGLLEGQCNFCGEATNPVTLPALNDKDYTYVELTEPSCNFSGYGRFTWKNTDYGTYEFLSRTSPAGHKYEKVTVTKEPTHNEFGNMDATCARCGDTVSVYLPVLNQWTYNIEAEKSATCTEGTTGYYVFPDTTYGDIRFAAEIPPMGHTLETTTTEVTCTTDSVMTRACVNCDYSTSYILVEATGHSFGNWETDDKGGLSRTCATCGEVEAAKQENPFEDVSQDMFCHDAVLWAYYNNITTGKDATHFNPSGDCTRSQVVTFLWRAAGEPKPQSTDNPFPDVPGGRFYTNAVLWAVEQGITTGFKDGTFGPNKTCTRAQIVTFLWRYAQEPAPKSMENPFPDVNVDAYYGQAVLWAVEEGITGGFKDGTFGPDKTCKRDQIVTFLYRYMVA